MTRECKEQPAVKLKILFSTKEDSPTRSFLKMQSVHVREHIALLFFRKKDEKHFFVLIHEFLSVGEDK